MGKKHINMFVWHGEATGQMNIGDMLNYYIIDEFFNRIGIVNDDFPLSIVGSTISYASENSIIAGPGLISKEEEFLPKGLIKEILGVRGKLSFNILQSKGYKIKYGAIGDPGLLIKESALIKSASEDLVKRDTLACIPHYIDFPLIKENAFTNSGFLNGKIKLINVNDTLASLVKQLSTCRYAVSSSLHGIILRDCLDIPSVWVNFSNAVFGNGFKFIDYFSIADRKIQKPLILDVDDISTMKIKKICEKNAIVSKLPNYFNNMIEVINEAIHLQDRLLAK